MDKKKNELAVRGLLDDVNTSIETRRLRRDGTFLHVPGYLNFGGRFLNIIYEGTLLL